MPRPEPRSGWSMAQLVALVLRGGVLLAAAVTLTGGVGFLLHHSGERADYHVFQSGPAVYRSLDGIGRGVLQGDTRAVVLLGIVLLIATPVARVMLSLVGFLVQRDRLYVAITGLVLAALLYSLVLGGRL